MGGREIDHLISLLAKLPGFGPRSARRAALKMLQHSERLMLPLAAALTDAARAVRACTMCGNLDSQNPCTICSDPHRDRAIICIVETVSDLWALERAHVHHGLYHVLGGTLSPLSGIRPEDLNVRGLLNRVKAGSTTEVILALSATVDGATTAHWLTDQLRTTAIAVTHVGQGVPVGGALDVLDDGTLAAALSSRKTV